MRFNSFSGSYEDEETGLRAKTKNGLLVKIKRFNYDIPYDIYLSNRFIINNIIIEDDEV